MNDERDRIEEGKNLYFDMMARDIEKRKIQAGYPFKTAERKDKEASEKWVYLTVKSNEALQCDLCDALVTDCSVHLCIDRVQEVDEVRCNKCWDKMGSKD